MTLNKIFLYANTIKHLKVSQVYWRVFYKIRDKYGKATKFKYPTIKDANSYKLKLIDSIAYQNSYDDGKFNFLNKSKYFNYRIDWNFLEHGKLWCYNLNYFEYLDNTSKEDGLKLINQYIKDIDNIKVGMEAFPIALRGINWIKFLVKHDIHDKNIDDSLYAQYYVLKDNFELHLLGNHLLEDAFSLLIGSYYFNDEELYKQAKYYLVRELNEQVLEDGGHFELSPMYHQLMLFRLLECINVVKNNTLFEQELLIFLEDKAKKMLQWLQVITFKNGDIPLFNDSAFEVAPKSIDLFDYALRLGLKWEKHTYRFIALRDSGYYKYRNNDYELVVDMGNIGPDYIPGHAHCDIFNFEMYYKNKPIIVDTGTSTYENNESRAQLRSTKSHNTVMVKDIEQSETWASFRVANRAKIVNLKSDKDCLNGQHNGYLKKLGILHTREFKVEDKIISIIDTLNKNINAKAYLHFHPTCKVEIKDDFVYIENEVKLSVSSKNIKLEEYLYQPQFNKYIKSKKLVIEFETQLNMEIVFENS
jgi:hypothetical protein